MIKSEQHLIRKKSPFYMECVRLSRLSKNLYNAGLFKSETGRIINADLNGALNILVKVIGKFKYDPIVVCSTPIRINI